MSQRSACKLRGRTEHSGINRSRVRSEKTAKPPCKLRRVAALPAFREGAMFKKTWRQHGWNRGVISVYRNLTPNAPEGAFWGEVF